MLLPFMIGTLVLTAIPATGSILLAFTQYDGFASPRWVGFANFADVLTRPLTHTAIYNSLYVTLLALPLRVLGALGLALALNKQRRGLQIYRTAIYMPSVVPTAAYALLWLWVVNPLYGPINTTLGALGLYQPGWLADPVSAKWVFVFMSAFQLGEGFLVLLVALYDLPAEMVAAAQVDGANRLGLFRYIMLPHLRPWLILLTCRDIIITLHSQFTPSFFTSRGDPAYSTFFLPYYVYEEAFDRFRFGSGYALMGVMTVLTILLILLAVGAFQIRSK